MDCARINTAHDDLPAWLAMIDNLQAANRETGHRCKICVDLAGPRMRAHDVRLLAGHDRVFAGDRMLLLSRPRERREDNVHEVLCTMPDVVQQLHPGESVWFDEGRIECVVDAIDGDAARLTVRRARAKGEKLKPQHGMNFPDSSLVLSPLTAADRDVVAALVPKVDMFGYSFVGTPSDVVLLQHEISSQPAHAGACGIVLKIETARAVRHLPDLIVQSAGANPTAVMIARGDLAVEIGYRRLAEMQEEILWMCEAAHVPVVWATQVLDRFVKTGRESRAEFTDAAMAERADCVMLNKGPYVVEAVEVLGDVLGRMEGHQTKKTSRLRKLGTW